jgi:hypothetical protein
LYKITKDRSSSRRLDGVEDKIDILDYIEVFTFHRFSVWKGDRWNYGVLTPAAVGDRVITEELNNSVMRKPECVEFYQNRDYLAGIEIVVEDLTTTKMQL